VSFYGADASLDGSTGSFRERTFYSSPRRPLSRTVSPAAIQLAVVRCSRACADVTRDARDAPKRQNNDMAPLPIPHRHQTRLQEGGETEQSEDDERALA
jgi:hypothetical protein